MNLYLLREPALLLVKYANPSYSGGAAWVEYRTTRRRSLLRLQALFAQKSDFRFCVVYAYDKDAKRRLHQIGYFDRNKLQY
jgi:hypothetical protein